MDGTIRIGGVGLRMAGVLILVAGVVTTAAVIVAATPTLSRSLFAAAIGGNLVLLALRWPRAAIVATMAFLPFLAVIRRLLISSAGWSSVDPLLLVGPLVAITLCYRLFVLEGRRIGTDTESKLILALLVLATIQAFNPSGVGVLVNFTGLLFLAMPLLWFFVGREILDRRTAILVAYLVIAAAVVIAIYGIRQTEVGFPSWDEAWVQINGYTALSIDGKIRGFGTLSSSTEYASFLSVASVIALAALLHGRFGLAIALPVLGAGILLASGRAVLVLTVLAIVVMAIMRAVRPTLSPLLVVAGIGVTLGVLALAAPLLDRTASNSSDPLISHQLEGLAHPFDSDKSTLGTHWGLFADGVASGFRKPLGYGTGSTNLAAAKLGGSEAPAGTENDVSNVFVGLGLFGGLIYLVLIAAVMRRVATAYARRRDFLALALFGILLATLGQWLNGGHYALAPLTWLLVGWAVGSLEREDSEAGAGTNVDADPPVETAPDVAQQLRAPASL